MANLIDRCPHSDIPTIGPGSFPTALVALGGEAILLRLDWSGDIVSAYTVGASSQTWRSEAHPLYELLANV